MKRLIFSTLFLAMHFMLAAQTYTLNFSGLITDANNGPAPGVIVYFNIMLPDSTMFTGVAETGANGQYQFSQSLPNTSPQGYYNVSMLDCTNVWYVEYGTFGIGNNNFVHNFNYCTNGSNPLDSCSVNVILQPNNNGAVVFSAIPYGTAPFSYLWMNGATTQSIPPDPAYFGQYCVTVTDAEGCVSSDCYPSPASCDVYIATNPASNGLTAVASGLAPFSYQWNNGQTSETILPNAPGLYCVTITGADGCTASSCYQYGGGADSCGVWILLDTVPPNTNGWVLTAIANGTAPFTFQWNVQNWQTPSIQVTTAGTYCVTVTDANGCVAQGCITLWSPGCSVTINQENNTNADQLTASVNANAYSFLWNTGDTTQTITPSSPGTYCVTVTGNGCTATDCHYYIPSTPYIYQVQGYVYLPDSLFPVQLIGVAELYQFDANSNQPELVSTVNLQNNPNSYASYYSFGQLPAGVYLVKIVLDPASPYFDEYLPTYFGNVEFWNEATLIHIPAYQTFYNVTLVDADGFAAGGQGQISGNVSEGDGLLGQVGSDRSGSPLEGVSILLYDSQGNPLTHTLTDVNGNFSFTGVPFGTYKLVVEIVGHEQAERWVTLSPEHPASAGNDFEVTENGILSGISWAVSENGLHIFPNPVKGVLNVRLESSANLEAQLSLATLTGQTVLARTQNLVKGRQTIEMPLANLPTGIYFLQVTSGREVISRKVVKE